MCGRTSAGRKKTLIQRETHTIENNRENLYQIFIIKWPMEERNKNTHREREGARDKIKLRKEK